MPSSQRFHAAGRDVYLVTGTISQTVNICTPHAQKGLYEWKFRFPVHVALPVSRLEQASSLDDLTALLTGEFGGVVEVSPNGVSTDVLEPVQIVTKTPAAVPIKPSDSDTDWIERARQITELCINELVQEFVELPYLHRVEHSIHARLYSLLRDQPLFDRHFPLARGAAYTQPVHKEWPETIARPENEGRRGSFDLAILSPSQLFESSLKNFTLGLLDAAVVIEMGLNYRDSHLRQDGEKLINSNVRHGYLVHLVREQGHEKAIDDTLASLRGSATIKVAYARVSGGQRFLKRLGDEEIIELEAR